MKYIELTLGALIPYTATIRVQVPDDAPTDPAALDALAARAFAQLGGALDWQPDTAKHPVAGTHAAVVDATPLPPDVPPMPGDFARLPDGSLDTPGADAWDARVAAAYGRHPDVVRVTRTTGVRTRYVVELAGKVPNIAHPAWPAVRALFHGCPVPAVLTSVRDRVSRESVVVYDRKAVSRDPGGAVRVIGEDGRPTPEMLALGDALLRRPAPGTQP